MASATVDPRHGPTGGSAEFLRGERFVPAALAICRDGGRGFYLFGCDAEWHPVTDTWHQTLDEARDQAERDHPGTRRAWLIPNPEKN